MESLRIERSADGITRVVLARTARLNAFDEVMIAGLSEAFHSCSTDAKTRVVVLAAEGRCFCAGADIRWMQRQSENDFDQNLADSRTFAEMLRLIDECPKPTLAAINGDAYGGGVGLIAATDLAVSVSSARFAVSEARFGILPAVIGPYLVRAVGARQAQRLALTTLPFSAQEALGLGLIQEVVEPDELDAAVERLTGRLLASGPLAMAEIKTLYRRLDRAAINTELRELTAHTNARVRATDEAREGFAAFLEKRSAGWMKK
jgi:methylglutaconyl-CoA hydratase